MGITSIDITPWMFNPLFYHLKKYLNDASIRYILVYGGSSAGKTHEIIQATIIDACNNEYNLACFRKEQSSVRDTLKNDYIEITDRITNHPALRGLFEIQQFKIIFPNDNYVVLRGLDDPGKVKGLKGFKKLYFDEFDQFTKRDFSEATRRLRGMDGQQIIASWNPVSEDHWIKKEIIDTDEWQALPTYIEGNEYSRLSESSSVKINKQGNTILVKTNYLDNKWIVGGEVEGKEYGRYDKHVLAEFDRMKRLNPYDYQVYGEGEWGVINNDDPWFWYIRRESMVENLAIWEDEKLLFSFDFNFDTCACTVFQLKMSEGIRVLGTHVVYGGAKELAKELRSSKYGYFPHEYGILVTGDPNGNAGNAAAGLNDAGKKRTAFLEIKKEWGLKNDQFIAFSRALLVHERNRDFCNNVLYRIPIYFDDYYCEDLWAEIFKAKPTINKEGTKIQLYKDRSNGYEMDRVDSFRYGIVALFQNEERVEFVESKIMQFNAGIYNEYKKYDFALKPQGVLK